MNRMFSNIKTTVHSYLPNAKVMLLGSRARGNNTKYSDYDILIVTEQTYTPREKNDLESKISKALVDSYLVPFDVILQSEDEMDQKNNLKDHIVYYALKEAIEII